jgi:hypothetical protein
MCNSIHSPIQTIQSLNENSRGTFTPKSARPAPTVRCVRCPRTEARCCVHRPGGWVSLAGVGGAAGAVQAAASGLAALVLTLLRAYVLCADLLLTTALRVHACGHAPPAPAGPANTDPCRPAPAERLATDPLPLEALGLPARAPPSPADPTTAASASAPPSPSSPPPEDLLEGCLYAALPADPPPHTHTHCPHRASRPPRGTEINPHKVDLRAAAAGRRARARALRPRAGAAARARAAVRPRSSLTARAAPPRPAPPPRHTPACLTPAPRHCRWSPRRVVGDIALFASQVARLINPNKVTLADTAETGTRAY